MGARFISQFNQQRDLVIEYTTVTTMSHRFTRVRRLRYFDERAALNIRHVAVDFLHLPKSICISRWEEHLLT